MSRVIFVRTAAKAGAGQLVERPVDLPALPDRGGSISALWAQEVVLGGVEGTAQVRARARGPERGPIPPPYYDARFSSCSKSETTS